jgi:hypothetical protein
MLTTWLFYLFSNTISWCLLGAPVEKLISTLRR